MVRIAAIYDNTLRPETTGFYCRRALHKLAHAEHFLPSKIHEIPPNSFDLFLRIDDGLDYSLPAHLRPSAFWAIDTHIDFNRSLAAAQPMDYVFAAQRDGAEQLRSAGITAAEWLPLACDPKIHAPRERSKRFDISFVGNIFPGPRLELLERLRREFPSMFIGQCFLHAMAEIYASSKIVFNRSIANDLNMRVFEALASGSLLLTNDLSHNGQSELFENDVHLATYASADELIDKAKFYLARPELCQQIGAAGRQRVLEQHTYVHRMRRILEVCLKDQPTTVSMCGGNPIDLSESPAPRVSACLVSWKRPDNIRRIVENLRRHPMIDDIIIWNNEPEANLSNLGDRVTIINSDRNFVTYGRYKAAALARHDVIYTQDDDCIVGNIDDLFDAYRHNDDRLVNALKSSHLARASDTLFGTAQMSLVGWGAFFHKEWINVFDDYIRRFGEDELLHRKADRIFTLLLNRRHYSLLAQVEDLDGARGPEALSLQPDHLDFTKQAIDRCLKILRAQTESSDPPTPSADMSYFSFSRPEIADRAPTHATRVLDIGCGTGQLGRSLKQRQPVEVVGIEYDPAAGAKARQVLDEVHIGDIETSVINFAPASFDAVTCGDVLEHLRQPNDVLKSIRTWLKPNGRLIASIPNIANHAVIRSLLAGNWTYESAGLLDRTHLRFFTRREIEKLLYRTGFAIDEFAIIPDAQYAEWVRQGKPKHVSIGPLRATMPEDKAAELFAYQYLVTATLRALPNRGLTSIVIITHNEIAYTQQCLNSIRLFTDEPIEIIVVDNGSADGTREWLQGVPDVRLIPNRDNRGFPAAANQGIRAATGDQILLLNNDTIVTTGWLDRMLTALYSDPKIGIVGPCSNNVSGEQCVPVGYSQLNELDGFAWDWSTARSGQIRDVHRLVGFCFLIRREVVDCIGCMDERFGIGCFEDDDFTRRAKDAGYRAVIADDSFVHHFGSRTFLSSGQDLSKILADNRRLYEEKWRPQDIESDKPNTGERPIDPQITNAIARGEKGVAKQARCVAGHDISFPRTKKLSLCMIVRDNERTIEPCLNSIRPWVDEMIVVDTGSVDQTPQICRRLGAIVRHFPWCDDFSAARNESLQYATGDWIFWMDSDDTISEKNGAALKALMDRRIPDDVMGFIMQVHCPGADETDVTAVDHVKVIRNRPDLRFEHRIHEQILPAIRRTGGRVEWTDIFVVHSGSDRTPEGHRGKWDRDFRLLRLDLAERPDHPFVLFNLGMTHADAEQHEEAVEHLRRSIRVADPSESHLRKAFALLVGSLTSLQRYDEAAAECERGRQHFPDDMELLFRQAVLHQHADKLPEAAAIYEQVLSSKPDRYFASIDKGIGSFKARHNLAIIHEQMGNMKAAEEQWRISALEAPSYLPAWKGWFDCVLKRGDSALAESVLGQMILSCPLTDSRTQSEKSRMKAELAHAAGDNDLAREHFRQMHEECAENIDGLQAWCRFEFEVGDPADAKQLLIELAERSPESASTWHNLGVAHLRLNELMDAATAFRRSLDLRPESSPTRRYLQDLLSSTVA